MAYGDGVEIEDELIGGMVGRILRNQNFWIIDHFFAKNCSFFNSINPPARSLN